jgi:hypothetical protein
VLFLIVVPLPPDKNLFAVEIKNNKNILTAVKDIVFI